MTIDSFKEKLSQLKEIKWEEIWTPENRRKFLIVLGAGIGFGLFFTIGLFFAVKWEWLGKVPDYAELKGIRNHVASEIYAEKDYLLGKYYLENRTQVNFSEIPDQLVHALVATEDARFFEHNGVDVKSLARVAVKSIMLQKTSSGGGSTISQQLAKNLFPRRSYSLFSLPINKFREMIIARRLEKVYTKEEILTLYLNTVSFGEKAYGIQVASKRFFGKTPNNLELQEAATLVGMLKATTYYNPRLYTERAELRRNVVLNQMVKYGFLASEKRDSLKEIPLDPSKYKNQTHSDGLAPYFREHLRLELQEILKDKPYNIYTDGLKIYTTIDARIQNHAEKAMQYEMAKVQANFYKSWGKRTPWKKSDKVLERAMKRSDRYKMLKRLGKSEEEIRANFNEKIPMQIFDWKEKGNKTVEMSPMDSLEYYAKMLNVGLMSMDPKTGFVKAWVGGINHRHFQYDHVTSRRQVGSTFKPIVYAAALEKGTDPCSYYSNEKRKYEEYDNWEPGNSDGKYEGYYSLAGGLAKSVNTIAVQVFLETGVDTVHMMADALGLEANLPEGPALALGAADLSLEEMVGVYGAFANQGRHIKPTILKRIETADGEVIYEAPKRRLSPRAFSAETESMMHQMLQTVVDSGTGKSLRYRYGLKMPIIGKTGTTQDQTDGWFIGAVPNLVTGVWVGADDSKVHFNTLRYGQGAATALPVWGNFMRRIERDSRYRWMRNGKFSRPSYFAQQKLDCEPYLETYDEFDDGNIFDDIFRDRIFDSQEEYQEYLRQRKARKDQRQLQKDRRRYYKERKKNDRRKKFDNFIRKLNRP